jgi:hypothetical protein
MTSLPSNINSDIGILPPPKSTSSLQCNKPPQFFGDFDRSLGLGKKVGLFSKKVLTNTLKFVTLDLMIKPIGAVRQFSVGFKEGFTGQYEH